MLRSGRSPMQITHAEGPSVVNLMYITLLCCLLTLQLFDRFIAQHEDQPLLVYDYLTVLLTCGFEASRMTAICE